MKKMFFLAVASVSMLAACNGGGSTAIKTDVDTLAYAIGMDFGSNIKTIDSTINVNVLAQGIKDGIANKTKMTREEAFSFINNYFAVVVPAKAKKEAKAYMDKVVSENPKAKQTESGLVYEVVAEGAEKPSANDTVVVNYVGNLINGTKFDSSYDRGEPAEFLLSGVIRGWTEGLQLVGKGGKIKLWIPSDLGYGERGNSVIPANSTLIFEVELLDIKPAAQVVE